MSLRCHIAHGIPGRARFRFPQFKKQADMFQRLASFLQDQAGVTAVRSNPDCTSVIVNYDPSYWKQDTLQRFIEGLSPQMLQDYRPRHGLRVQGPAALRNRFWLPLLLASVATLLGLAAGPSLPWTIPLTLGSAVPLFVRAFRSLAWRRKLNVDVLDASATVVLATQGQWLAAAFMVWLVNLADTIRDHTMAHCQRAISDVLDYENQLAWVVCEGKKAQIPTAQIKAGDVVVVYPGGRIPIDGRVISGIALVDQQILTGESMPVKKKRGDSVYAATVIRDGKLYIRTEHVAGETRAAQIVRLITESQPHDTRIQNYAEHFADRLVPYSFAGAGALMLSTQSMSRAASWLIIDYGTGIRVAAPTTVLASLARSAHSGILIKGGRCLEQLAEVDALVFDKTGTLTYGALEVVDVIPQDHATTVEQILCLAAAAEKRLDHPVAQALVKAAEAQGLSIPERTTSRYTIGLGVRARVDGITVLVGNSRFMDHQRVDLSNAALRDLGRIGERGASPVCVAVDDRLIGTIALSDTPRPEAADVIRSLRDLGVREIVLLTGDHAAIARETAETLGISRYVAEVFPEQKVELIKKLQKKGHKVAIVGDGINDSPALAQSDVGIAVGWGTETAREAADVVLLQGDLWQIPLAFDIAREAMSVIRDNWKLIWVPNTLALGLTFLGVLGPIAATLISNGSAVLATLNALRPLMSNGGTTRKGLPRPRTAVVDSVQLSSSLESDGQAGYTGTSAAMHNTL